MSDVGVFGKQSACFSQAIAMETTLEENLCYNLPRSGFNYNDHFGGGKIAVVLQVVAAVRATTDDANFEFFQGCQSSASSSTGS